MTVYLHSPAAQGSRLAPVPATDSVIDSGQNILPPPREVSKGGAESTIDTVAADSERHSTEPARYFSNRLLERPTVPASGPDPERFLKGRKLPKYLIRLRLYVDALGTVRKIDLREPEFAPPEDVEAIKAMFMATRFIPGDVKGTRLPSYQDIEIDVSDYSRD